MDNSELQKNGIKKENSAQIKEPSQPKNSSNQIDIVNDWYKMVVQNALEGFCCIPLEGNILDVNEAFCQMVGYTREELINNIDVRDLDLGIMHDLNAKKERTKKHKEAGGAFFETRLKRKDGQIIDVLVSSKYLDISPGFIIAFHRDITEQKRIESNLKQYREHLEESIKERTAELETANLKLQEQINNRVDFSRALVHELKTPLTSLLLASELLIKNEKDEILKGVAKTIYEGSNTLEKRIDKLLNITRGEIGLLKKKPKVCDIVQLVNDICNHMAFVFNDKGQSFKLHIPKDIPKIYIDPILIQEVLYNLLDNASKFTPEGGEITLNIRKNNDNVEFEVKDTGVGIAQSEQQSIFEYYHSRTINNNGIGLGLSLAKMFVELHGGNIWIKSKPGKGSIFTFSLPYTRKTR